MSSKVLGTPKHSPSLMILIDPLTTRPTETTFSEKPVPPVILVIVSETGIVHPSGAPTITARSFKVVKV